MATLQQQARALGDPTRHAVFRHIAAADEPVDVSRLTERFSLNHNAIRQHLAKLVAAGLVVEERAPSSGPGRPRLVYRVDPGADGRWGVTGPYERLSRLLVEMLRTGQDAEEVGRRAAAELRVHPASGDTVTDVRAAMARQGFEPETRAVRGGTEIVLHACPFETAATADRDIVCSLHLGIAEGLADGTPAVVDELIGYDPRRAGCRIRLRWPADGAPPPGAHGKLTLRGRTAKRTAAAARPWNSDR